MPQERFHDFLGLERHAARTPDAIALAAPGRKPLTYAGLWGHLQTIPRALNRVGFRAGEVAALTMPSGPELITAFLGISGIGAGAPLNPASRKMSFTLIWAGWARGFLLSRTAPIRRPRRQPDLSA